MTYRDDHEAAIMRADAADRAAAELAAANRTLASDLEHARHWLGGPRRRAIALTIAIVVAVATGIAGFAIGRVTSSSPVVLAPPAPALPEVAGVMAADGPTVGHFLLVATRCVVREDGIELSATGSDYHKLYLTEATIEVELPAGDFFLEKRQCKNAFEWSVVKKTDGYHGHVLLDCRFDDGSRLQGRIDFLRCR